MLLLLLLPLAASSASAGIIKGVTLEYRSGKPLARTRVVLTPLPNNTAAISVSVLTDRNGQFLFHSLPAGGYLLSANKAGYSPARYGIKPTSRSNTPIFLDPDGNFMLEMRLHKLGVIVGEAMDENRVGIPELAVYAYQAGTALRLAGTGKSDDRGVFRIAGLKPGKYYVRTGPKELEDKYGLLPTYYGQAMKAQEARVVQVRLDDEVIGTDIEPVPGKLSTLVVTVPVDVPVTVTLFTDMGKRQTRIEGGGTAKFDQLAPGQYELAAESISSKLMLAGYKKQPVFKEEELTTLEMAAAPSVRTNCDASSNRSANLRSAPVFLRRKEPAEDEKRQFPCGQYTQIPLGTWEMSASAPAGSYVSGFSTTSLRRGKPNDLIAEARMMYQVTVALSTQTAKLQGAVKTRDGDPAIGVPVALYALNPDVRIRMGGILVVRTDNNGAYRFIDLPPGSYEVLSSLEWEDGERDWQPDSAKSILLEAGAEGKADLVLEEGE